MKVSKLMLLLNVYCIIVNNLSFGQSGGGGSSSFKPTPDFMAKMEKVLPNTPTTTAIGKFGGVDVALNTGTVKKVIDLKPLSAGKLSVPVQLRYNSMGIRVTEYPTNAGLGWHIVAGGVISRVVYGSDDLVATRFMPGSTIYPNEEDPATTNYCYQLLRQGNRDAAPDIFTYTFGNYSGKFMLDQSRNILPLEITNIKFSYNDLNSFPWKFKAVTPDGTEYYFGEQYNAIEATKMGPVVYGNTFVNNAWQLTTIKSQFGNTISFTYEQITGGVLRNIIESQVANASDCELSCTPPGPNGCFVSYSENFYESIRASQLNEITSNDGDRIVFEHTANGYPEKPITEIKYYINSSTLVNKFVLNYNTVQSSPYLVSIKEKSPTEQSLSNGHDFSYYSPELTPPRFSLSQDHWGFFNSATNATLVPPPPNEMYVNKFPNATANRNPNPEYAVVGMLKNIIYPTGGQDEIEYEPNTISETVDVNGYISTSQSVIGTTLNSYIYSSENYFDIGYDGTVKLTISCEYTSTNTPSPNPGGTVIIRNTANNQEVAYSIFPPPISTGGVTTKIEFAMLLPGNYAIKVGSQGMNVRTACLIRRRNGLTANYQTVQTVIGGLRTKRVTTTANSGAPPMIKRYYYGTLANKEQSSAQFYTKPNYWVPNYKFVDGTVDALCSGLLCSHTFFHSIMFNSSLQKLYLQDGAITEYNTVLESLAGDNFENGAIEHKYDVSQDIPAQNIRTGINDIVSPYSNTSIYGLGEKEVNVYKKSFGNSLVKIKSNLYENYVDTRLGSLESFYFVNEIGNLHCVLLSPDGSQVTGPTPVIHSIFGINRFDIIRLWKYLKTEKTIVYDENGQNPATTQIDYVYDDLQHLNLTQRRFINSAGQLLTENFTYPEDYKTQQPYTEMVNRNIVFPAIDQVHKKGEGATAIELSHGKTTYLGWNSNQFFAPSVFEKSFKGGSLKNEITFNEYDNRGNILQTTEINGTVTSYLWGYGQKFVVAKVIGKTYLEILSQSGINMSVLASSNPSDNDLSYELNKVRALSNCFVASYAYKITAGISSETDVRGRTTYYEYDNFNRLILIRDNDGGILKKICYNYTGQQEDCSYTCPPNSPALWQNTGNIRCQTDIYGENTGYQEYERINMNSCNPATSEWVVVPGGPNPTACTPPVYINLTSTHTPAQSGYMAMYTKVGAPPNTTPYIFPVSTNSGLQSLGTIPAGNYNLTIYRATGVQLNGMFKSGCYKQTITGTSATFYNIAVSTTTCNSIIITLGD